MLKSGIEMDRLALCIIAVAAFVLGHFAISTAIAYLDATNLAACEEYGYTKAKSVKHVKYCGIETEDGTTIWQKLSYIKREARN